MIRRKLAFAALVAALVMPLGASGSLAAAPKEPDTATVKALLAVAQELIDRRTSALLDGSSAVALSAPFVPSFGRASAAVSGVEQRATNELTARRDALRQVSEAYTSANSTLTVVAVTKGANSVVLDVEEYTSLTYAKIIGDEPDYTAFLTPRRFEFVRDSTGWVLKSHGLSDTRGPAPINEPTGATAEAMAAVVQDIQLARRQPEVVAAGDLATTKGSSGGDVSIAGGYNYGAMAAYAERWWGPGPANYNPHYRTFNERGGDCTNFVSQVMREGGWTFVTGFYKDGNHWWYQDFGFTQTWSWASVAYWYAFAALRSHRTTILATPEQMGLADVLQADFSNDGSKDHTMVVSYRSTQPYLTYHTNDTLRKSLSSLKIAYPSARWIPHRT